jgi:extracellular factor (EF) 3-hydroxypalmitic acid methyl ester biosynthesis protein
VLNLGCGPAHEVQQFLNDSHLANFAEFTLLDFNAETLAHTQTILEGIKNRQRLATPLKFEKKSVHHLLKEAGRGVVRPVEDCYDFVYCAGLFDYLTDSVCRRLTGILYDWVVPGGTLVATNVDAMNPIQNIMDLIFEWHLIYRSNSQFARLAPSSSLPENVNLSADETGCNIFIEVKKAA